jgi:hypothetical protein
MFLKFSFFFIICCFSLDLGAMVRGLETCVFIADGASPPCDGMVRVGSIGSVFTSSQHSTQDPEEEITTPVCVEETKPADRQSCIKNDLLVRTFYQNSAQEGSITALQRLAEGGDCLARLAIAILHITGKVRTFATPSEVIKENLKDARVNFETHVEETSKTYQYWNQLLETYIPKEISAK